MTPPALSHPCPLRILALLHGPGGYRHCVHGRTGPVHCLRPGREVPAGCELDPEFLPVRVVDQTRGGGVPNQGEANGLREAEG